ncbi:acyltransferase family protein [Macrococcoides caseolyticum]|uniref:acyltransferase family protein n=1 Tax=Macrococcoides caseolyticum TaxID=69966 RepID=UPI001F1953D0|nr:acyltransferase family protein [Macrococcus caseolyticus]MCE4955694.1 acyltransferase family protein [Macrococcus caseolyticus]
MTKERDHYFDNARFLLIVLVVFGHLLRSFIHESHLLKALYMFIYSFHMPAFVLISGYFAKGIHKPGYIMKVTKKLLVPYIIFQSFYAFYYYFIDDVETVDLNPFDPQWAMWFLLSLFSWQLMLFVIKDVNPWVAIISAFIVGIAVGYFEFINNTLSLSRTFVFFPLFLIGYYAQPEQFIYIRDKRYVPISIAMLIIVFSFYLITDFNFEWLFGSKPYVKLEHSTSDVYSGLKRAVIYFIILISTASFLNVVPNRQLPLTYIGTRTMFIYLLHGLFIGLFRANQWDNYFNDHIASILIFMVLVTIVLVYTLSMNATKKIASPVVELKKPK